MLLGTLYDMISIVIFFNYKDPKITRKSIAKINLLGGEESGFLL